MWRLQGSTCIALEEAAAGGGQVPGPSPSERQGLCLQDRVQADDLVKMLFSPEEMDLPQEQPLHTQGDSPQPGQESAMGSKMKHKDEL